MQKKYELLTRIYEDTIKKISQSPSEWLNFLNSASKNYKLPFEDQVLIFAQRSNASAVAEIGVWNKKFKRWVNRGATGIAVFDNRQNSGKPKIKYYFDISDTHESENSRPVILWKASSEDEKAITDKLEKSFGNFSEKNTFPQVIIDAAEKMAVNHNNSNLLKKSVAYAWLSRCGFDCSLYFSVEDFEGICDIGNNLEMNVFGALVMAITEKGLREISSAILESPLENRGNISDNNITKKERAVKNGQIDLHRNKRIQNPELDSTRRAGRDNDDGERRIRPKTQEIPEKSQGGSVRDFNDDLHPQSTPSRDRADSTRPYAPADKANGEGARGNGGTEKERPNEMGRTYEQYPALSGGDSSQRTDLRLIAGDEQLPSIDEQQQTIKKAEEQKSSAFSISKEDIDSVLQKGSSFENGKYRIYRQFQKYEDKKKNIDFLKAEYGTGGGTHYFPDGFSGNTWHDSKGISIDRNGTSGNHDIFLKWTEVEKRLRELINDRRYLNPKEKEHYADYLESVSAPDYEVANQRKIARQSFIDSKRDLSPVDKRDTLALRLSDFIRDLDGYEKDLLSNVDRSDLADVTAEQMEQHLNDPATVQQLIDYLALVQGRTTSVYSRSNAWRFGEELLEIHPMHYLYHEGDAVYIGADKYEVAEIGENTVSLINPAFPLFGKEFDRADFEEKLRESTANNHLKVVVTEHQKTELPPEEEKAPTPAIADNLQNFRITDDDLGIGTTSQKFAANMAAIRTLKTLESEGHTATPEEQEILSKYVGWGGLSSYFESGHIGNKELISNLTEDEYITARESTLTAFYTPPVVIKSIYKALERMGFSQGNILEPSCGTGNFFGLLPESMANAKLHGVELDSLTGRIAKQLYPKANIAIEGFEDTRLPDNHFDVVLGNVPFGDFKVNDNQYNKHKFLIHDFFFAKALDKVRAGGVVAFITSKGTMDKANSEVRKYIAQRAELLGSIRLPDNTFTKNAGTEVTSDIIFLQKRERVIDALPDWIHLDTDENGITMNSYFVQHPEMVLGTMEMQSSRFGFDSACKAHKDIPLADLLHDAVQHINGEIPEYEAEIDEDSVGQNADIAADPNVRNFSFALVDGKVYFRENERMTAVDMSPTVEKRIKGLIEIRDSVRNLIEYQANDYPEKDIIKEREKLNSLYDNFTAKYGLITSRANDMAFSEDSSYFLLCSLESIDENGKLESKADIFTKRTIKPYTPITHVDTASEALAVSLAEKAKVDLQFMSSLTSMSEDELKSDLEGIIFKNIGIEAQEKPYVTDDEYLSGNIREKLKEARYAKAISTDNTYEINVRALEDAVPKDLTAAEISVRLGATWIPADDIKDFIIELLKPPCFLESHIKVMYSELTGEWKVDGKSIGGVLATKTYGTGRVNAYKIIENTLNLKDVQVFDTYVDDNGKKKSELNKKETIIAQAKQSEIKAKFGDWIWEDYDRRARLVRKYNDIFNSIRPREYDGSHINFVGMSPEISMRSHQRNAVARAVYGGNSLLAHVVGAGKTYTMTAIAQESKRLGLCNKSLFVVPNHLTEQWAIEYLRLYPSARILVARKKDFETKNRKKFCGRIATGEYDAVIIGHSQFEKIPLSIERQKEMIKSQINEIVFGLEDLKRSYNAQGFTIKQLEKTKKSLEVKLEKLNDQSRKDDVLTFEELGIDRLFVDEAHHYKNLFFYTKMRNVGGIAQTEAQKSSDLFMKCRYIDEVTGGKGIVFATGTPVSNSMVELYTMQRYLQYNLLKKHNINNFDSWASTFGETVSAMELSPEGTGYRLKTRFAKFYNLPELMSILREAMDIQTADMLKLPVPKANYHNVSVDASDLQKSMVASLAQRAEDVRNGTVEPHIDNMLKITNDGRKIALDQRLENELLPDFEGSKVNACVKNVYKIWEETSLKKSAQVIFCDSSTPKFDGNFNIYDDIREKLIKLGIPKEEIKFIHEAKTDVQKKDLFASIRKGNVRVVVGSTAKMGAGTNMQDKLIALHDLDVPWKPSDLEQRSGRIIRQGNQNPEVEIFRYVTQETFDAYSYQLVESKQRFIGQIMTDKSPLRIAEDVDSAALSYAEIKMLATGNPLIKEKMDLDVQVSKLSLLRQSYLSQRYSLQDRIKNYYPAEIKRLELLIVRIQEDIQTRDDNAPQGEDVLSIRISDIDFTEKTKANEAIIAQLKKISRADTFYEIGSYHGFKLEISYSEFSKENFLHIVGKARHTLALGKDSNGNFARINNTLKGFEKELEKIKSSLEVLKEDLKNAETQLAQSFPYQAELDEKSVRLNDINRQLDKDNHVEISKSQERKRESRKLASDIDCI